MHALFADGKQTRETRVMRHAILLFCQAHVAQTEKPFEQPGCLEILFFWEGIEQRTGGEKLFDGRLRFASEEIFQAHLNPGIDFRSRSKIGREPASEQFGPLVIEK